METNANSKQLATLLNQAQAGFTGLIIRKKGQTRGGKLCGDDLVHVVVFAGFHYERLVQRSLDALPSISTEDVLEVAKKNGQTLSLTDIDTARNELQESFLATLSKTNHSSTAHVYEPLMVDEAGEKVTVRGCRVYQCVRGALDSEGYLQTCHCRECTGDPKAPLPGTIYLQGLKVWSTLLEPALNGPIPEPKSAPKTIAKNILRDLLPVGKYVSYALEPGTEFILRAGGAAHVEAAAAGFTVTAEMTQTLDKVLATN